MFVFFLGRSIKDAMFARRHQQEISETTRLNEEEEKRAMEGLPKYTADGYAAVDTDEKN